ncbi:uncharacterized protein MELLADRAFT_58397 [Melampsora larici-populina 98AG31]|uniref:Uncharacterized protein n=1 Tax=Melampsora larici-populina (strain 98AG31 / pathotype 3-4-7) TaxID=747676 RepID=F4R3D6_MELLP|nr:uncharacterized protein MELLADRAFT_58397 [Melampsora larici-populina 98AG31]EGG13188.1 hypothetical protein MELLADRAFT_58397 [Melampsora larici-populina 98AG31]
MSQLIISEAPIAAVLWSHTTSMASLDTPGVNKIVDDFSLLKPLTGWQDSLLTCVQHIKQSLDHFTAHPASPTPFALQYPNINTLNELAIQQSKSPVIEQGCKAFMAAAEVNSALVKTHFGPMTKVNFERTQNLPTSTSQSLFSVKPKASTQLNGVYSSFIEVPGTLNGSMPSQGVGSGQYHYVCLCVSGLFEHTEDSKRNIKQFP